MDAVHAKGGFIFLQLWHLGRTVSSATLPPGYYPVSASAVVIPGKGIFGTEYEVPHALTVDETPPNNDVHFSLTPPPNTKIEFKKNLFLNKICIFSQVCSK